MSAVADVPVRHVEYPNDEKRCSRCGETKPVGEFGIHRLVGRRRIVVSRQSRCVPCHRVDARESYRRRGRKPQSPPKLRLIVTTEAAPSPVHSTERVARDTDSVPSCVCGHVEYFHPNGGACSCGACPAWFEKGL